MAKNARKFFIESFEYYIANNVLKYIEVFSEKYLHNK